MKRRRTAAAAGVLLAAVLAGGCATQNTPPLSGDYQLAVENGEEWALLPTLTLEAEEQQFSFSYDPLSSYWPVGSYTVEGNQVIAATDDGRFRYVFTVVDEHTLAFDGEESDEVGLTDSRVGPEIQDGSRFERQ